VDYIVSGLQRDKYISVAASDIRSMLSHRGATKQHQDHEEELAAYFDTAVPQYDEHGTAVYPYKETLVSYYSMNTTQSHYNACPSGSTESVQLPGHTIEHIDPTTSNGPAGSPGSEGAAASYYRVHKSWPPEAQGNPLFRAMLHLIFDVIRQIDGNEPAPRQLEVTAQANGAVAEIMREQDIRGSPQHPHLKGLHEAMVSAFRVKRDAELLGDPGPEGVHQVRWTSQGFTTSHALARAFLSQAVC